MTEVPTSSLQDGHSVDLTLALLGVIQGLAFSHLAEKLPRACDGDELIDRALAWAVYGVCLLIVIRVFQTYAQAAIEGTASQQLELSDLFGIFIVGLLEYAIFDEIGKHRSNIDGALVRVAVLGIGAIVLHAKTGFEIRTSHVLTVDQKKTEIAIEYWNVGIAASIVCLGFLGARLVDRRSLKLVVIVLIGAALALNIAHSLQTSRGGPAASGSSPVTSVERP